MVLLGNKELGKQIIYPFYKNEDYSKVMFLDQYCKVFGMEDDDDNQIDTFFSNSSEFSG